MLQKYLAQRINYVESTKFQKDSSHFYPISIQNKSCYTYLKKRLKKDDKPVLQLLNLES